MSTLNALKLSTAKKSLNTTPVVHRRNKLGKKLWEQIQLAQAHLAGKQFTTTRFQTVRDEDGVRRSVEVPKRVRAWWWNSDNGKIALNVRYGARVVELAKGKSTIEVVTHYSLFLLITNGSNTNTKPNRYAVCLSVMS